MPRDELETGDPWRVAADAAGRADDPDAGSGARAGLGEALDAGEAILASGGSALDAVEAAARVLEDDPCFNAGRGSVLTADGQVELDAAIMDGRTRGPARSPGSRPPAPDQPRAGGDGARARTSS